MLKWFVTGLTVAGLITTADAGPTGEKKARDQVNAAIDQTAAKIKDCGKTFKLVFDWTSYDAIDWKKADKDKTQHLANELVNIREWGDGGIGPGINKVCADKDYKAALSKIDTIVYKPTDNNQITLKATVTGKTLTFENYTLGSTRYVDDYVRAAKDAL